VLRSSSADLCDSGGSKTRDEPDHSCDSCAVFACGWGVAGARKRVTITRPETGRRGSLAERADRGTRSMELR